jgi:hypothetical protein
MISIGIARMEGFGFWKSLVAPYPQILFLVDFCGNGVLDLTYYPECHLTVGDLAISW